MEKRVLRVISNSSTGEDRLRVYTTNLNTKRRESIPVPTRGDWRFAVNRKGSQAYRRIELYQRFFHWGFIAPQD